MRFEDDFVAADAWAVAAIVIAGPARPRQESPDFSRSNACADFCRLGRLGVLRPPIAHPRRRGDGRPRLRPGTAGSRATGGAQSRARARRRTRARARASPASRGSVHGNRREPSRGERLLDAGRRQRIDERAGITGEQPAVTGICAGAVWGCVPSAGTVDQATRSVDQAPEHPCLAISATIDIRRRPAARQIGSLRIDHRGDVTHAGADRHRPHPAVVVRFDQRVRVVRHGPAVRRGATRRRARWCAGLVVLAQPLRRAR